MSKRYAQVVLLVEDKQHRTFVERLLKSLSYPPHKLRSLPIPAGTGSGEQYVRENYAKEVAEIRRVAGHKEVALVVVIDADSGTVAEHSRQLADALQNDGQSPRGENERIIHLIPRRSIETWIHFLMGNEVNETDSYPDFSGRERECQPAVDHLIQIIRSNQLPEKCPESLGSALAELKRL